MYHNENDINVWVKRTAGAVAFAFFLWGLTEFFKDRSLENFGLAIGAPLVGGFFVLFVAEIVRIVGEGALEQAKEFRNPFAQGAAFIGFVFVMIGVLDLLLFTGQFVVWPTLSLVFYGDFGDSYWGCRDHWYVDEDGSFCNR